MCSSNRAALLLTVIVHCTIIDKNQAFLLILCSFCVHSRKTCILFKAETKNKKKRRRRIKRSVVPVAYPQDVWWFNTKL